MKAPLHQPKNQSSSKDALSKKKLLKEAVSKGILSKDTLSKNTLFQRLAGVSCKECAWMPRAVRKGVCNVVRETTRFMAKGLSLVIRVLIFLALLLSAIWLVMVFWFQLDELPVLQILCSGLVTCTSIMMLLAYCGRLSNTNKRRWLMLYGIGWVGVATWFALLSAKQDRQWQSEVAHSLTVERDADNPNLLTVHNVRDFEWVRAADALPLTQPTEPYYHKVGVREDEPESQRVLMATERWVTRQVDLRKLTGVDIINSYWMGKPIGHTLLSFRFDDERPLTFSIEIRKEQGESFSALGGFFRKFELILVGAEERDIVYTRSNVRGEQVYVLPIEGLTDRQMRELFLQYVALAESLNDEASWYNTLMRNCTTAMFDMVRQASDGRAPWDYRILASGYVPNYLFDEGLLPRHQPEAWTIEEWYEHAHVNPKVADFSFADNQQGYEYSRLIREGLPAVMGAQGLSEKSDKGE